jgi:hypothetical protein
MSGDPRHSSGVAGVGAAAPWAAAPVPRAEPAHAAAPPAAPEAHPPGMPDAPSQGGSQSTPVYFEGATRPRALRRKEGRAGLVTASLKVPRQVKARWSSEASRRGIRLSEYLRLLLQSGGPSCAEDGKSCESDQAADEVPAPRDRRIRWVAARRWSPQHGEMMGVLLQIHAELRQIQRAACDSGQASSASDLIELNSQLSRLSRRLDACCAQFALDKPSKRGVP